MKQCLECKKTKSTKEFYFCKTTKDNLRIYCKSCWKKRSQKYAENNSNIHSRVRTLLYNSKTSAKKRNLPWNLDETYLKSIVTDKCPVFGIDLKWNNYNKKVQPDSPSLDKIIPELGYVKGNVVFISNRANTIKHNATEIELYAVADWLHDKRKEVMNAFQIQPAPVPTGPDTDGDADSKRRAVPTTGSGEDGDDAHHHCGTISWEDANHRTQTGGGDGVGHGDYKVAAFEQIEMFQDYGGTEPEIVLLEFERRYLSDKP